MEIQLESVVNPEDYDDLDNQVIEEEAGDVVVKGEDEEDVPVVEDGGSLNSFAKYLFEKFGYEWEDDHRFNDVDDLVGFINHVISEGQSSLFANDDIRKINEYVKNGGSIEDYFAKFSYSNLSKEETLQAYYKITTNWDDNKILRQIEKLKLKDELEDEYKNILPEFKSLLDKHYELEKNKLETQRKLAEEEYNNYINNFKKTISSTDNVNGYHLTDIDKEKIFNFFIPNSNGVSGFTEFLSNPENLVKIGVMYLTNGKAVLPNDGIIEKEKAKVKRDILDSLNKKVRSGSGVSSTQLSQGGKVDFGFLDNFRI